MCNELNRHLEPDHGVQNNIWDHLKIIFLIPRKSLPQLGLIERFSQFEPLPDDILFSFVELGLSVIASRTFPVEESLGKYLFR